MPVFGANDQFFAIGIDFQNIYDILDMSEDDWTEIENEIDMNARAIGI